MDEAVAGLTRAGVATITVVPLFLAVGGHMRLDLPQMVRAAADKHQVVITVRPTIGESEAMIAAIADWAATEINAQT